MIKLLIGLLTLAPISSFAMIELFTDFDTNERTNIIKNITYDNAQNNADGTVTILNPKLVRGRKNHLINGLTSTVGVCKAMGFSKYLEQSSERVNVNFPRFSRQILSYGITLHTRRTPWKKDLKEKSILRNLNQKQLNWQIV